MQQNHNPHARDREQIFGTGYTRPQSVSAASFMRPYEYYVVRTDDGRLSRLDDHEKGRIIVRGFNTRHNAVGHKVLCNRRDDGEYIVTSEQNDGYEPERKEY